MTMILLLFFAILYVSVGAYTAYECRTKAYESWASAAFFGVFWLPLLWLVGAATIYEWLTD